MIPNAVGPHLSIRGLTNGGDQRTETQCLSVELLGLQLCLGLLRLSLFQLTACILAEEHRPDQHTAQRLRGLLGRQVMVGLAPN
jgi:hypothetical protein